MTSSERCLKPEKREISCWHPRRRTHPNQNFTFALKLLPDGSFDTYSFLKDFCFWHQILVVFDFVDPHFSVVCTSRRLLLSPFPLSLVPEGAARQIGGSGADAICVFFFPPETHFLFELFLRNTKFRHESFFERVIHCFLIHVFFLGKTF